MDMMFESRTINAGWNESWYLGGTDTRSGMTNALQIAGARLACLSRNYTLTFVRTSVNIALAVPQQARRQRNVALTSFQGRGQLGTTTDNGDAPWSALKVRWITALPVCFSVRNQRGIPDKLWSDGGPANIPSLFNAPFRTYANQVTASGGQLRHAEVTNPATFTYHNVTDAILETLSRRATGRPSFLPRGRAPKRRTGP
jgi:hypothetical protein